MDSRHYKLAIFGLVIVLLYFAYKYSKAKRSALTIEKSTTVVKPLDPSDPKNNTGIVLPPAIIPNVPQPSASRYASYQPTYGGLGYGY